jgi:hypothetical protein
LSNELIKQKSYWFLADDLLLGLIFDPEDGGDIFLRNGGLLPTNYTEQMPC